MFIEAFEKTAVLASSITPEQYYDLVHEKDPYIGSLAGALVGAAAGAKKGKAGGRAKGALIGAGLGAAGGGAVGHGVGRGLKHYQAHRVRRLAGEMGLRATPQRHHAERE